MARIRMIKPEFFDDPDLADLSMAARLFFVGLWTEADREGRLVDDARRLKARIFPYDNVDCEALMGELQAKDLIRRYPDVGESEHKANLSGASQSRRGYVWVRSFAKHQRPHPKEPASLIPPCHVEPCKGVVEPCKKTAGTSESGTRNLGHGSLILDMSLATCAKPPADTVLTFATMGLPSAWHLTAAQVAGWSAAYPGVDILGECRKAEAWLSANRRKTAKGMPRFLVAWLGRAVDKPSPFAAKPAGRSLPEWLRKAQA